MERAPETVVVGGGLVGLCSAFFLRHRGAAVTVVDHGAVGGGAARGNAALISPVHLEPLAGPGRVREALRSLGDRDHSLRVHPRALPAMAPWLARFALASRRSRYDAGRRALAELDRGSAEAFADLAAAGVTAGLDGPGTVFAFSEVDAAERFRSRCEPMREFGHEVPDTVLDGDEVRALVPQLSASVRAGLVLPSERTLDPRPFVDSLIDALRAGGAELVEHAPVERFETDGRGRVTAVVTARGRLGADAVVLAAGAGTPDVARRLGARVPVQPGKGYSFTIPLALPRAVLLHDAHVACTPLADGLRVAGTMEFAGRDASLDPRRIDAMVRAARPFFTDTDWEHRTNEWVGPRPVSADGLPVIGRPRRWENVVLATGHGMWGFTLGPATGAAVAELVATGATTAPLGPFAPGRFGPRRSVRRRHR